MYMTIYTCAYDSGECRTAYKSVNENRQVLHRNICMAYGNVERKDGKLLFNVTCREDRFELTVMSAERPTGTIPGFKKIQTANIDEYISAFRDGDAYSFAIKTTPFYSLKGKKHYISDPTGRLMWLDRQGRKYGFRIDSVRETETESVVFSKKNNEGDITCKGAIDGYVYRGRLSITDEKEFKKAYINGIGQAKAWGFGMLMLGPA